MEIETLLLKYLRGSQVKVFSMLFAKFERISKKNLLNLYVTNKGLSAAELFTSRAFVCCWFNFFSNAVRMMSNVI